MDQKKLPDKIIENYQSEEKMMILFFAQWCINNDFVPEEVFLRAYPNQSANQTLREALELSVAKEEAGEVKDRSVLGVLSLLETMTLLLS